MKILIAIFVIISANAVQAAMTGSVVQCTGRLKGTYSLDYLRMVKEQGKLPSVATSDVFTLPGIIQYAGLFGLSNSAMHFFMSSSSRPDDFSKFNVWQQAAFGFDPFPLDKFAAYIPAECKPANNALIPAMVINNSPNNRIVAFDPKIVNALMANDPAQVQMLKARLWLSEFTDDEELIYAINRLWHLKDLLKNRPDFEELGRLFQQLSHSPKNSPSVCERSQFILEALKRTLHKNCDQITAADLASIQILDILDKDRTITDYDQFEFRKIDLAGLTSLRSFEAHDIPWVSVALLEGYFANATSLQHLNLSRVDMRAWLPGLLPKHKSLLTLNLARNFSANSLDADFFKDVFSEDPLAETALDLTGNTIESFTAENTAGLANLKRLNLAHSRFESLEITHLRKLQELTIINTAGPVLVIKSSDYPEMKKLTVSKLQQGQDFRVEGSWPQLESLDLSLYSASVLRSGMDFNRFPNLRFLDLSANSFMPGAYNEDFSKSGFSKMTKLEHVRFLDTNFVGSDGSEKVGILLGEHLPPSVKLLEFCTQRTSDGMIYVRSYMRKLMQERPYLKVRTKTRCMMDEEWIDVTL